MSHEESADTLIIGYGRAGKRHAAMAKSSGLQPIIYDPFIDWAKSYEFPQISTTIMTLGTQAQTLRDFSAIVGAFEAQGGKYAVICTPPNMHLEQMKVCSDYGLKVLCEKPLCDIGQLAGAGWLDSVQGSVMVAYNYRYHPALMPLENQLAFFDLQCEQYRDSLPSWGLLLDHCSHDLDIVRSVMGKAFTIDNATYCNFPDYKSWQIATSNGLITETVFSKNRTRKAELKWEGNRVDITPDPQMFTNMWQAFLEGDYQNSLQGAIETQRLLEMCLDLNYEK